MTNREYRANIKGETIDYFKTVLLWNIGGIEVEESKKNYKVLAVDLGASSGRLMSVELSDNVITLDEIHRFSNSAILVNDRRYTDILNIYKEIISGLNKAYKKSAHFESIGIDSWGVDFGMIDKCGELISNPYHYRDNQSSGMIAKANSIYGPENLFKLTGIQNMWYNTIYQILGIKERHVDLFSRTTKILPIADLLGFFLTGNMSAEYTGVMTTQMYDISRREWSEEIIKRIGLRKEMFPDVCMTGTLKGYLKEEIISEADIPQKEKLKIVMTAQHDSAAAAFAVPAESENYLFINSGTWSIIGMVMDHAIVTDEIFEKGYSKETLI